MTVNSIDTNEEDGPKKSKRDWKGMAAMVVALMGVLGFFWNKIDALYDRKEAVGVQRVSYETLAARVNELNTRLERMERSIIFRKSRGRRHARKDKEDAETISDMVVRKLKALMPAEPESTNKPALAVGISAAEAHLDGKIFRAGVLVFEEEEDEPVEVHKKLPTFRAVQEQAEILEVEGK